MHKIGTLLFTLFFTLALQGLSYAQELGTVEGTIVETGSGEPLYGANVLLMGTSKGAAADADGKFIIRNVPVGTQTLRISYLGYQTFEETVEVTAGQVTNVELEMEWAGVEGEEITVSAQAQGQVGAINEQRKANTITNIVSSARIKELPDVNAAESVGRLPGVSIQRDGGEASKIAIRGLSPKFNNISINGVKLPSTGSGDRSVDLSLISSSMLDGIEVSKAVTPDMDADAIGGTVNLRMRTAPDETFTDVRWQGGYNALQNDYGNYKFVVSVGDRFLNKNLGVIANINLDSYNRSADTFSGGYQILADNSGINRQVINNLSLNERYLRRSRTGGNLILDYRIPKGEIVLNGIYNQIDNDGLQRTNQFDTNREYHDYSANEFERRTSIYQFNSNIEQQFRYFEYNVGLAYTSSQNDAPKNYYWSFQQQTALHPDSTLGVDERAGSPESIPGYYENDPSQTFFQSLNTTSDLTEEEEITTQANIKIPFNFSKDINGYLKFGGKLRYKDRFFDRTQLNGPGLYFGGGREARSVLAAEFSEFGLSEDGVDQISIDNLYLSDYQRSNFIGGDYPLGYALDQNVLRRATNAIENAGLMYYGGQSVQNDYQGTENYKAFYVMSEIQLWDKLTVIPGFRLEMDETDYDAKFVSFNSPTAPGELPAFSDTSASRSYDHFLPMVHLKVEPYDWLDIRFAYTETISRPDFSQFAPNTYIGEFRDFVNAPNTNLGNSESKNLDLSVSVYNNKLGYFGVSAFSKEIDGLIRFVQFPLIDGQDILPELNLPNIAGQPQINTYINSQNPASVKGIEFDWQTYFWYLPSFLQGITLNVNYTLITSETDYPYTYTENVPISPRPVFPPFSERVLRDTVGTQRIPDQPSNIANVTLGYDYKGFSGRFSIYYQGDVFTGNFGSRNFERNELDELEFVSSDDVFTGDIFRMDVMLRQQINNYIQVYTNINNLNGEYDRNYMSQFGKYPTYEQYYGITFDVGLRVEF
jgi:TonB-dependent receptor